MADSYDVIVIGGGPAGTSAAITAAREEMVSSAEVSIVTSSVPCDTSALTRFDAGSSAAGQVSYDLGGHFASFEVDLVIGDRRSGLKLP